MSCYHKKPEETVIIISGYNKPPDNNAIFYDIVIKCPQNVTWSVKHRYSEFYELNEKLVQEYSLPRDWLPPKKVNFLIQKETTKVPRPRLTMKHSFPEP